MKQFAVIGLGGFGYRVVKHLSERGHNVLAIDKDPLRVELVQDMVTQAVHLDATSQAAMVTLGLEDIDSAVIAIGDNLEASVLITMILKELGVQDIIVEGTSREQRKILTILGARRVIIPEEDAATRLATTLAEPSIVDNLSSIAGHSILETISPKEFVGHSLSDLGLRRRFGVECLAVRRADGDIVVPDASFVIEKDDRLILFAQDAKLNAFKELI